MKPKLAIVIGHSASRPGAWGKAPLSMYEFTYNKELADVIETLSVNYPLLCRTFLREGLQGLRSAYAEVNKWIDKQPGVCIELHFNSFTVPTARGTETLFKMRTAEKFAEVIHEAILPVFERDWRTDRGVSQIGVGRGSLNLTLANCPSIILEPFFGSNPADARLGMVKRQEYATAILNGVVTYFQSP